jgi:CAAX protease family protein
MLRLLVLGLYVAAPFVLLRLSRKFGSVAAILAIWLPIEFRLLQSMGVPTAAAMGAGMLAGIFAFRSRPDILDVSAAFNLRKLNFRDSFVNFAVFATCGIPLALGIGFIRPALHLPDLSSIPPLVPAIFFLNALPEEILFRGIIQHVMESALKSRFVALTLGALIFGLSHLNNGTELPNYKYFVMATLAGVFYGNAWRRERNVLTSTVTHTLVNTGWRLFFR